MQEIYEIKLEKPSFFCECEDAIFDCGEKK